MASDPEASSLPSMTESSPRCQRIQPLETSELQVEAGALTLFAGATTERGPALHLLELGLSGHLLAPERRLDAVEQTLEPSDQLRLRDP